MRRSNRKIRLPVRGRPALSMVGAGKAANFLFGGDEAAWRVYSESFAYGHREIILDAAGLDHSSLILGRIPHGGWAHPELSNPAPILDPIGREMPQYMWNEPQAAAATRSGAKKAVSIGAPWLYLLQQRRRATVWDLATRNSGGSDLTGPIRGRILVFPHHSTESDIVEFDSMPARMSHSLDPSRTTVCLAWQDFLCRSTRDSFSEAGFSVTCAGYRGVGESAGSTAGDRVDFLPNLLEFFDAHDLIVSDAVSTALIYAASLGKRVRVMSELGSGSRHQYWTCESIHGPRCPGDNGECTRSEYAWMKRADADARDHLEQLANALGPESLRSQSDLRAILKVRKNGVYFIPRG